MDDASQWLSVAEVAERLGRSTEQVRRYLREGRLTGRRIGGQWFIAAAAVDAFARPSRGGAGFLERLPAARHDPLGAIIAIGQGGGDIAAGKDNYRASIRRRRP